MLIRLSITGGAGRCTCLPAIVLVFDAASLRRGSIGCWLLLTITTFQWHAWERWALLHYAVLKTTNAARVRAGLSAVEARHALWQAAMDGASGSHLLTWVQQAMLVDT